MFATIKREFGHLDGVFVNAGYSEFLSFEEVTEQSFDKVIAVNFKGAYFTIQKALPLLRQGSSVIINASVGARKGWPTTSTVSTCKAAVVHLARILSAELVDRGIRVNTLSPGPTDTAMFGRFPGEEQGEAVKGVLANQQSKQADGRSVGNREAGSLPRVGRFCVRRRGRLPDRRRGHGHFGRGRLSLVADTCICMFLPGDCGAPHALAASEHERAIAQRPCGERADDRVVMQPRPATTTSTREPSTTTRLSRWVENGCQIAATAFESSAFNRTQPPFRRIVLCFLKRRLLSAQCIYPRRPRRPVFSQVKGMASVKP